MTRVIVCGGRGLADWALVYRALDRAMRSERLTHVIHGGAPGADTIAARWAIDRCVPSTSFPADWKAHGRAAGPIRNQRMIEEADPALVIAFPGGKGTEDMVRRAGAAGIPVIRVDGR